MHHAGQIRQRTPQTAKLSRTKRPDGMSLEDWQIELRREHGRTQEFDIKNLGDEPFFSEFLVRNSQAQSSTPSSSAAPPRRQHLHLRRFTTNTLGTCKHIECTLGTWSASAAASRRSTRRSADLQ